MEITSYLLGKKAGGGGGTGSIDWPSIGYESTPNAIITGYNYAKTIQQNWNPDSDTMYRKFSDDTNLTIMPFVDTSKSTSFEKAFSNCSNLYAVPSLDTSKATSFNTAFSKCSALQDLPLLDFSSANILTNIFNYCGKLTNVGGFKDLGKNFSTWSSANYNNYTLYITSNLTKESAMNIINNLYDIAAAGCKVQKIYFSTYTYNLLSADEIAIATNKGWNIQGI